MHLRRKRKHWTAPCIIHFRSQLNEHGTRQLCVYAECTRSGQVFGPVWGHGDSSVRRALASLKNNCCVARFHVCQETQGRRVLR